MLGGEWGSQAVRRGGEDSGLSGLGGPGSLLGRSSEPTLRGSEVSISRALGTSRRESRLSQEDGNAWLPLTQQVPFLQDLSEPSLC